MNFNINLFHFTSRTCEAAGLRKSQVTLIEDEELNYKNNVMHFYIERHKTDNLPVRMAAFPHRDTLLQDHIFSESYDRLMNNAKCGEDYLFPDFQKRLRNKDEKMDTETAKLFKTYYEHLVKISKKYENQAIDDEYGEHYFVLPAKYTGHTPKKSGVNMLADHLHLQVFVFRAGWLAKTMHTAFDYKPPLADILVFQL